MSLDHSRTAALAGIPNAGIQPELYQTPRVGLEPTTKRLTAAYSTIELPGIDSPILYRRLAVQNIVI